MHKNGHSCNEFKIGKITFNCDYSRISVNVTVKILGQNPDDCCDLLRFTPRISSILILFYSFSSLSSHLILSYLLPLHPSHVFHLICPLPSPPLLSSGHFPPTIVEFPQFLSQEKFRSPQEASSIERNLALRI